LKFAILQNQIGIGGRNRVVAEVISILNDNNIVPTVFTLSDDKSVDSFKSNYGCSLSFHVKNYLNLSFKRGYAYQVLLLNMISCNRLKKFDIIFNCNDNNYFLPNNVKKIHYINFPFEAAFEHNDRYNSIRWLLYKLPLKLLFKLNPVTFDINDFIVTNSNYSRNKIIDYYRLKKEDINVVYPPTINKIENSKTKYKEKKVVSVGAFVPDKRQLEQIKIAQQNPKVIFNIIGMVKSKSYFDKCYSYIKENNIRNVNLHPNSSYDNLNRLLNESLIFLHTRKKEHFGISIVEAIAKGCIPVIHNSGGQIEIVTNKNLRFENINQASQIISSLINDSMDISSIREKLQIHIEKFKTSNFKKKLKEIIDNVMEE